MGRDSTKPNQLALAKGTYQTKLADLCGGVVIGSTFRGASYQSQSPCTVQKRCASRFFQRVFKPVGQLC